MTRFRTSFFNISILTTFVLFTLQLLSAAKSFAQDPWKELYKRPSTLNINQGLLNFNTPQLNLKLVKASQTLAALNPVAKKSFDFTPNDRLQQRSSNGMYQTGDLNLRIRMEGQTAWTTISTASHRIDVTRIQIKRKNDLAAADLAPALPPGIPLDIKRYWRTVNGRLVLQFTVKNTGNRSVEIGSLGIPLIFNNILQGKTLEETHAQNVFYDPYIGNDAGYLQVTPLSGRGPALLVVPFGKTPFEAYNPLLDDPTPRGMDFEGFYEWMVYSKAYAENEWKAAEPWNKPTSGMLKPGETKEYGLQFLVADSIRSIEHTLIENKRPVAVGVPGYVLPQDVNGTLFLNYAQNVKSLQVEPDGALTVTDTLSPNKNWKAYTVKGNNWGRARLTIIYADGLVQTINYKVIKPEAEVLTDFGHFLTREQWYENKNDLFGRNNAVITYDYEKRQQVLQDRRVWIAGLSDEGGAGSWLGAMMKELVKPDREELVKLQLFADHTMFGNIQNASGDHKYGVHKSVYYYQPDSLPKHTYSDSINWKTWSAWSRKDAGDIGRSYDYPHVTAAHWVLYRLARNHTNLVIENSWQWHLENAYQTALAMVKFAPDYAQFGQMEGTIFYLLLTDLKAEGWADKAVALESAMKTRADVWHKLMYPFGSEMPWDSTGQEEVYLWSKYFGYDDKAQTTINAILGYMPTIPNWGYNGSARRYWDFLYGGKLSRIERQLHHYGSGLNAIPLLSEYRDHPEDTYLLRVGYGGLMGSISNITEDGFGPAAFHSFPSTLKIDGLSGDYGPNFFGYAVNAATYITNEKELGWLAFGGNLAKRGDDVLVTITNGAASRVYIAPANLWLTLDAGTFKSVAYNTASGRVTVSLNAADGYTANARLHIAGAGYAPVEMAVLERGAYVIPLSNGVTTYVIGK